MSNTHIKKDKFGQVVQNFFLKSANVIVQSRQEANHAHTTAEPQSKLNKWFNLETLDTAREDLRQWRSTPYSTMAPLVIETYLDLRDLGTKQSLVLQDKNGSVWTVNTKKTEIVMERWLIELDKSEPDDINSELPLLYKRLIVTIRYLFTISRLLPCYKLLKKLSRVKLTKSPLALRTRILDGSRPIVSKGRIGLSKPIISNSSDDHLIQKRLTPVLTSVGSLKVSVSYRKHIDFELNDNEETLSNHFLHIDKARTSSSSGSQFPPPSSSLRKAFKSGAASNISSTVPAPSSSSSPLTKIDSSTSLTNALKIQRSGSTGATAPIGYTPDNAIAVPKSVNSSFGSSHSIINDLSSSGGTPKYSSSFGRVARRTSLRRSSTGTPSSFNDQSTRPLAIADDDIKDFVKMLDNKAELQLSYSPNIEDSLIKFQRMKGKNALLSESLTTSIHNSSTSSPPPHLVMGSAQHNMSKSPSSFVGSYSRASSMNPSKLYGAGSVAGSASGNSSESLPQLNESGGVDSRFGSASPASILKRNIGPSNPTIAPSHTHAKMHRIAHPHGSTTDSLSLGGGSVGSSAPIVPGGSASQDVDEDDDELLFTMSDMNLPK